MSVRHHVRLALQQPAVVGDGLLRGQLRSSRRWIPGETFLGAFAGAKLKDSEPGKPVPPDFEMIFRRGRFGPLMAEGAHWEPLSYLVCKYRPKSECAGVYTDLAFDNERPLKCPECARAMDDAKGKIVNGPALAHGMHVELTAREQAKEEKLFRRSAIPRGAVLQGVAWFEQRMSTYPASIWIGGSKGTSGAAELEITPDETVDVDDAVLKYLRDKHRVVITLQSPGCLVDAWGRPALAGPDWQWELDQAFPGLGARVTGEWVRWSETGGWQGRGFPKPVERTIVPGSTFQLSFDSVPDRDQLIAFRDHGIGLRTHHGYGWFDLVAPTVGLQRQHQSDRESTQVPSPHQETVVFALDHPALRSKILSMLREVEEAGKDKVTASVTKRSWFERLTTEEQRVLRAVINETTDAVGARRAVDAAVRMAGGGL